MSTDCYRNHEHKLSNSRKINVNTLKTISINYILNNLTRFQPKTLRGLPSNVKDLMLRKFLCSQYLIKNKDFHQAFLRDLVNNTTTSIDLTSFEVDDQVLYIFGNCRNLRKLYVINKNFPTTRYRYNFQLQDKPTISKFTSEGLTHFLRHVPKLECLVLIENCEAVDDTVLNTLSCYCPKLYGLDIRGCINISDKGMIYLSQLGIRWLKLSEAKITDKGLSVIANGKSGKTLEEFQISKCPGITQVGLSELSKCCPKLSVLHCDLEELADADIRQMKQVFWDVPL